MGVTKQANGKWRARYSYKGKRHNVGIYKTKKAAQEALELDQMLEVASEQKPYESPQPDMNEPDKKPSFFKRIWRNRS